MIDPAVIAAAAAARLQVPADDLLESATAALEFIAHDISTTVDLLDDSALMLIGARLLTERIFQDVPTTTGDLEGFVTSGGVFVPEDLGQHLRDYWGPQQMAWGIA